MNVAAMQAKKSSSEMRIAVVSSAELSSPNDTDRDCGRLALLSNSHENLLCRSQVKKERSLRRMEAKKTFL